MSVPFVDLKRDVAERRAEYLRIAERVLDSGYFSLGPEVETFEQAFAAYCGTSRAVGVSGGTMALYASMLALGVGSGDEVILPANTFIATAEAVVMAGATPRFCDVSPETHLLDLATCNAIVTDKTKAIIPVHLYGQLVDMEPVLVWARAHNLSVIEDSAQAHGAMLNGKRAGSFGDLGCFSFYPTKNLGALGEGGAVVTNHADRADRVKGIRLHGCPIVKYRHDFFGTNLKMEALQGAFLADRLTRLDEKNARRRAIADRYRRGLSGLPIGVPADVGERHVYHLFVITTDRRDALKDALKATGIATDVHYPIPIHLQPAFARFGGAVGDCPIAERAATGILSLPMFPELRDEEVDEVIRAVTDFFLKT